MTEANNASGANMDGTFGTNTYPRLSAEFGYDRFVTCRNAICDDESFFASRCAQGQLGRRRLPRLVSIPIVAMVTEIEMRWQR